METDETEEALEQQRPINTKPCEEDQPKNMALTPIMKIHKLSYSQSKGPTTTLQPENPFNWRKNIDQRKEIKIHHVLKKVRHIVVGGMEKANIYTYENYAKNKTIDVMICIYI